MLRAFRNALVFGAILPLLGIAQTAGQRAVVDGPVHDGVEVTADLPVAQHVQNISAGGKGCCVFASLDMAARWHNATKLIGVIKDIREGGGWPEKVHEVILQHDPTLPHTQYEGDDPAVLDEAIRQGAIPCVTYGYGERYGNSTIYHMVNLFHLDDKTACVMDNNFPGTYEWMSRDEFLRRWKHPSGTGWCVVLLLPPPPPVPSN